MASVRGRGLSLCLQIPAGVCEREYVVKKSRFIARLVPVDSREDVNAAVASARQDYPDARHHCWAYILGKPEDASSAGMNDDGEPAGTAGRPILNVIQHGHLGNVLIIVIRYFGGIKLGAAGLVRAYGTATKQVLDASSIRKLLQWQNFQLQLDFSHEQALRHLLDGIEGKIEDVAYSETVDVSLRVPQDNSDQLQQFCAAHRIAIKVIDS